MMAKPLPATLSDAVAALRERSLTSRELLERALGRVKGVEASVQAFAHIRPRMELEAEADEADARWAAGRPRSPLDGVPIGIKDLIDTSGIPTEAGSRVFAGRVPDRSATVHEKLGRAGAIMVGKLRAHEFGLGTTTPPTRNPLDLGRIPGGSSGGSAAALAARMVLGALGTDTGGSIRIPACLNGIVGLRPTYGLVSLHGVTPLAWTLDAVGPMGMSAQDVKLLLEVIAGYDPNDPASEADPVTRRPPRSSPLRVGVPRRFFCEEIDPAVADLFEQALEAARGLGWKIEDIDLPLVEYSVAIQFAILLPEAVSFHERWLDRHPDLYGQHARTYLELALCYTALDYVRAQRARTMVRRGILGALQDVDLIATPTTPITAPTFGCREVELDGRKMTVDAALIRNCVAFAQAGVPAVTVPCGLDTDGMPVGLQLVGGPFEDFELLDAAAFLEEALGMPRPSPAI